MFIIHILLFEMLIKGDDYRLTLTVADITSINLYHVLY